MFYSVLFFIALTILVFVAFQLLNKSNLQFEEKQLSKSIILLLFCLVVIMNQLQAMSQFGSSNQLLNLFSPMDLIQLQDTSTIQELNVIFNKTKGIYWISELNNTLPQSLQLQFETTQKPYLHINFDESSALHIDNDYLQKKMNLLQNELLLQQQSQSIFMIRLETINIQFLESLEQIFDSNECIIILYGSKIKQSKHTLPSIYRFSQQLIL